MHNKQWWSKNEKLHDVFIVQIDIQLVVCDIKAYISGWNGVPCSLIQYVSRVFRVVLSQMCVGTCMCAHDFVCCICVCVVLHSTCLGPRHGEKSQFPQSQGDDVKLILTIYQQSKNANIIHLQQYKIWKCSTSSYWRSWN